MSDRSVSGSKVIAADPGPIFDLLADPARHGEIDGSGTVLAVRGGSRRLALGSKFGMDMKLGPLPYRISNEVVEFEENRRIAWAHLGGHRWRYELEPVEGGTEVTETFDWSTARSPKFIELMGYPKKHPANIAATLDRLAALFEARSDS
ncbi:MAG: SRPBCC family protein [Ilumatobacteraceae bacterium]